MVTYSTENPAFESTHSVRWWVVICAVVLWGIYALSAPSNATAPPQDVVNQYPIILYSQT